MIKAVGMGGLTTESRLLALEHPLINIIAIANHYRMVKT
jgi:hypothetical protein